MDAIKSQRTKISKNSTKELTRTYKLNIIKIPIGIANNTKRKIGNLILNESGHGGIYSLLLSIVGVLTAVIIFVLIKISAEAYYYLTLIIPLLLVIKLFRLFSERLTITVVERPDCGMDCNNCDHCKYGNNT